MLTINEIFYSIQGESTYAGRPCIFIRLTGCNLRCTYCDTEYAFYEGKKMSTHDILEDIKQYDCKLVEVTGGEPLAQKGVYNLMNALLKEGYKVLLETSGSLSMEQVPSEVIKIVDFKTPSSQMDTHNLWENLLYLNTHDEVKFVIGNREDYDWSKEILSRYGIAQKCATPRVGTPRVGTVLMSPTHQVLKPGILAGWIREDALNVRLQVQLHKYLNMP